MTAGFLAVMGLLAGAPDGLAMQSVVVSDRNGIPLKVALSSEDFYHVPCRLENVSPWVVIALLGAEDKRFYLHKGVDFRAIVRATLQNVRAARVVSGGSTITQQLVRTIEKKPPTLAGKIREAVQALKMERNRSKQSIITEYLNTVYFGHLAKGIESASRTYFGVPASDLSLAQAALLCGIPKSPARFDPITRRAQSVARQRTILNRLRDWGWIDRETWNLAKGECLAIRDPERREFAPHFTRMVLAERSESKIRTTIDARIQGRLERIIRGEVRKLESQNVSNGAGVVLDNRTGEVLAWVGSADFNNKRINGQVDCVVSRRQPGSALKPFLYAEAIADGLKTTDILRDEPMMAWDGYSPKDYSGRFMGPVSVRKALACSLNVPAVRVADSMGAERYLEALHRFGFDSLDEGAEYYGLGLALGNGEVQLIELANAYATLARGGVWKPVRIYADGGNSGGGSAPDRVAVGADAAFIVTSILSDNLARVDAFGWDSSLHMGFEFAAKTGTTKDYRDNWAVGYTPDWTIAVWVGNGDNSAMEKVSGISGAAPILRDASLVMEELYGSRPFEKPEGVREIMACPVTGRPCGHGCPGSLKEYELERYPGARACELAAEGHQGYRADSRCTIEHPRPGEVFVIHPALPIDAQQLTFRTAEPRRGLEVEWSVDSRILASADNRAWWALKEGWHTVDLFEVQEGRRTRTDSVKFLVVR